MSLDNNGNMDYLDCLNVAGLLKVAIKTRDWLAVQLIASRLEQVAKEVKTEPSTPPSDKEVG